MSQRQADCPQAQQRGIDIICTCMQQAPSTSTPLRQAHATLLSVRHLMAVAHTF